MQVGTVFKWLNFPYQSDGDKKDCYFVYFGKTGYGIKPVMFHCCTTTTQEWHYSSGKRKNHHIYRFNANEYGFPRACILDFDIGMESVPWTILKIQKDLNNIYKVGQLPK